MSILEPLAVSRSITHKPQRSCGFASPFLWEGEAKHRILLSKKAARPPQRKGSAALMLIVVLTLLVGTFTASVTSRMSHERQIQWHHRSVATLESAIDCIAGSGMTESKEIRLPIDDETNQWVIVESISVENQTPFYQATLFRDGEAGLFIRRPL